jgi:hypothetical protein
MSNATNDFISNLNTATFCINRIIPIFQIVFGTFGNLFNILIFTRRALRTSPSSLYFLVGSVNNCFVIYVALLTRYLATSWNQDPSATNTVLCKLRLFFVYASISLVLWFIVLASIDRFLSSSHKAAFRRLSSLPIARKMIVSTTIFIYLLHSHMLIFYKSGVSDHGTICSIFSDEYNIFFNFFFLIISCILPIVLMCIFGMLTILNVRNIRNRVVPQVNNVRNGRLRSNDRQLITMLLFQVLITTLISAPFSVINVYNTIDVVILKYKLSIYAQAVYSFAFNLFRLFYYTNPVIGFYIYTLTGFKFRVEMNRCIRYGLKSVLTATGLIRYLSARTRQRLLDENPTGINNGSFICRRRHAVQLVHYRRPVNMTSAV